MEIRHTRRGSSKRGITQSRPVPCERQALNKAERLPASIAAHKRMDLVDDDVAQIAEHARNRHVLMDQERLERLGRNLQDTARLFDELCLVRLRNVAMPVPDGDVGFFAEVVEAVRMGKKAASVLPEAVDAVRSTLSCVLKMASAAATWIERKLSQSWE